MSSDTIDTTKRARSSSPDAGPAPKKQATEGAAFEASTDESAPAASAASATAAPDLGLKTEVSAEEVAVALSVPAVPMAGGSGAKPPRVDSRDTRKGGKADKGRGGKDRGAWNPPAGDGRPAGGSKDGEGTKRLPKKRVALLIG
jgi:hypothetical protein